MYSVLVMTASSVLSMVRTPTTASNRASCRTAEYYSSTLRSCEPCTKCSADLLVRARCSDETDTVCERFQGQRQGQPSTSTGADAVHPFSVRCGTDKFYSRTVGRCLTCSSCSLNQVVHVPCSDRKDTVCGPIYFRPPDVASFSSLETQAVSFRNRPPDDAPSPSTGACDPQTSSLSGRVYLDSFSFQNSR